MVNELLLAATLAASPIVDNNQYVYFDDLVSIINIQEVYQLDLPYQFDDDINFNAYFGRDIAYLVYTLGQNVSDRPYPGSSSISDLNGLVLNTNYGGITDWETGDFISIYTDSPVYILVRDSYIFNSAIQDIAYDIGDDFGIGRALHVSSLENVVNDYQGFLSNRIELSALQEYYYWSGYNTGKEEGILIGSESIHYEWLDLFNQWFSTELFPGFKIYYLLLFALGLVVLKGVLKAVL